jgi:hypothetical protein
VVPPLPVAAGHRSVIDRMRAGIRKVGVTIVARLMRLPWTR